MRVRVKNFVLDTSEVRFAKYGYSLYRVYIEFKDSSNIQMEFDSESEAALMLDILAEKTFETK